MILQIWRDVKPNVISRGRIVDYQKNWKGRGYDTIVIAAPVNVKNAERDIAEYMMAVIVTRESGRGTQRFYVHEAFAIKKDELLFKTGAALQESRKSGNSSSSIYRYYKK